MSCWHCGTPLENSLITFRSTCDKCGSALHCCKNCRYYKPGLANDCQIPDTDPIRDREANNFCDEFAALNEKKGQDKTAAIKRFDDLFK